MSEERYNFTLHEVRYFVKHDVTERVQVSKGKRTSIFFDREANEFSGLNSEVLADLRSAFPGVNLTIEFLKMSDWLISSKGNNTKGSMSFITNWLSRAPATLKVEVLQDARISGLVTDYLDGAWKTYAHLETLNTKKL